MRGDLLASAVPQAEIVAGIDGFVALAVRNGEPAAGGDRLQILPELNHLAYHRAAYALQMPVIDARADMHVHSDKLQLIALHYRQRGREIAVPDTVFAVLAAGVGFLAVAVTKARIDTQPDAMPRRHRAELLQHVHRARVDRHTQFMHAGEGRLIQHIRRKHDVIRVLARIVARGDSAFDLAERHGIHFNARLAHQAQDMNIRAGFLRITNDIELTQAVDLRADDLRVINPDRAAVLRMQLQQRVGVKGAVGVIKRTWHSETPLSE